MDPAGGVLVTNRQQKLAIPEELLAELTRCGERVVTLIAERALALKPVPELVEAALVDDAEIGRVHGEFLQDPGVTDVITFDYGMSGEVVISVETAKRQAREFGTGFERELALYLVHGILHLGGYEDAAEEDRKRMEELQEDLLELSFKVA